MKNTDPVMGAKFNLRHIFKILFFWFFEPFFAHLASKFAKSANMTQKKIFLTKIKKNIKKRRISRWFLIRWKSCKKCIKKKLQAKQVWRTWVKVKKVHIFVTFLLITFFGCIFSKLFQRIRNRREILRFLIPILNFLIKNFFSSF